MKRLFFILIVLSTLSSCEQKECCLNPEIELTGRFAHEIPDCDNGDNPEINCTEWMEFINVSEVDILYGGRDIVQRFAYTQEDAILHLKGPLTSSFRVSFEIVDDKTLVRIDTQDKWEKSE